VRKLTAILLLLLSIVTTEAGAQLLKLPLLVTHLNTHLSEGRSRNVADFLEEHYSLPQHQDKDQQQDQQLPFKTTSVESFFSVYVPITPATIPSYTTYVVKPKQALLSPFTLQDHFKGIFHPPKSISLS
jgi:hypothetical protein